MIEQLISSQGLQDSLASALKQPDAASGNDVMRFNIEMSQNNKPNATSNSDLLQDVKVDPSRIDNNLLSMKESSSSTTVSDPLARLDSTYRTILDQMNQVPEFDKFLEMRDKDKAPAVRTNVIETKETDPAAEVKNLIDEMRNARKNVGEFSKDIRKWHITTQIWSANIKILTTVVSQASRGFKTLFRSAG